MRKSYKCSNVKFCMEDENQRRTWEYLQTMTRKDGSYGKVLSDAFVAVLDGRVQTADCSNSREGADGLEETLERLLDRKIQEMLAKMQEFFAEEISRGVMGYAADDMNGIGQRQAEELSDEMMDFAFAIGE